ncbi:non-specific lipid-transfer protein Lac s 1-like [Silene latifolia]|uniref:non-specific lipid-transfer protein Lac s 1-like n=1 Tax=Silene latifolia TaxID=37657 RepID=UPI003D76BAFB
MARVALLKFACAILVSMVLVAPRAEAALTCGTVTKNIAQCVTYLKGTGTSPSTACCTGVTTLKGLATTLEDKKTACGCLKTAASSMTGLDTKRAADLPGDCGVTISYAISPNTDCSKVN